MNLIINQTLNAFVISNNISTLSKYMKPIKLIDKSNLLICPMPGKLIKIMVNEQDSVEEGQSLCVVEAMKMENTLVAQKQGRIKAIKFNEGDTLSVDQVIIQYNLINNYLILRDYMVEKKSNLENWKLNALKELKKNNLDGVIVETPEGISIKPLYTASDIENKKHLDSLPNVYTEIGGIHVYE